MNRPGFGRELMPALGIAVTGAIGMRAAEMVVGTGLALRLAIAGAGTAFALAILVAAPARAGRLVVPLAFLLLDVALLVLHAPIALWAAAQAAALWLLRCAYFHKSAFVALFDLFLAVFALAAAAVSLRHNGSVFLALWCFGLVQSLHGLLAAAAGAPLPAAPQDEDRFDAAQRQAEAALRRLV